MSDKYEPIPQSVLYQIEGVENIDIRKDLVYKIENLRELHMDIYYPENISEISSLPAVIFVHGESSKHNSLKEIGQYQSFGRLIAASGIIAVTFNHRMLLENNSVSEVKQDIDNALEYVLTNSKTLKIDANRLCIWSISAGVPFGLSRAMVSPEYIKCIVAYYGFCDFKSLGEFFNLNISDEEYRELSPISILEDNSNSIPPLLVARAGLDNPIINQSLDNFILKALSNNLNIDIYNHPTGQHAFDLFNDNERTSEIIKNTLEFIKNHL